MSSRSPRVFNPPGHAPFRPTYSHISEATLFPTSKLISIAGQTGRDYSGKKTISPSFAEQVKDALSNLQTCLDAAGAQKTDIVSVRQYVVNLLDQDLAKRDKLYLDFMDGHMPPVTLVGVQALATKDLLYEIEVTAVVSK